jgi:hypothetical protein
MKFNNKCTERETTLKSSFLFMTAVWLGGLNIINNWFPKIASNVLLSLVVASSSKSKLGSTGDE